jgi:probable F420-dependent oxidoreductase
MEFGVLFPERTVGTDAQVIGDVAVAAESAGCSYLLKYDHILGVRPPDESWHGTFDYRDPFHEPLTLFGYLAGVTSTLKFVTGVLVLPQRNTALVAKQAAEVAIVSDGRLRLGVGVGWNDLEYEALEMPFGERGRRIEEQVEVLTALWNRDLVSIDGRWHQFEEVGINPRPPDRIPIWMGGGADAVLRRTARLADGWVVPAPAMSDLADRLARLRRYCRDVDRDPDRLQVVAGFDASNGDSDDWVSRVEEWASLGVTHVTVNVDRAGETTNEQLAVLRDVLDAMEAAGLD